MLASEAKVCHCQRTDITKFDEDNITSCSKSPKTGERIVSL